MPEAWKEVLEPLGTDAVKEHMTDAPWIVVLFRQQNGLETMANPAQHTTQQNHVELLQECSFMQYTTWVWSR